MTNRSSRIATRMPAFFLYSGFIVIVFFVGTKIINFAADVRFYHYYLLKWKITALSYSAKSIEYPEQSGNQHVAYMENLIRLYKQNAISVPRSNTKKAYIYQINGTNPFYGNEKLFILSYNRQIIIYNLPELTMKRLDNFIDGQHDIKNGSFTGKKGKNGNRYTGQFKF